MSLFGSKTTTPVDDLKAWQKAHDAFFNAIKKNDTKTIDEILLKYSDAMKWEKDGQSTLHYAITKNAPQSLVHLIDNGADIDKQCSFDGHVYRHTLTDPLDYACYEGKESAVFALIQRGATAQPVSNFTAEANKLLRQKKEIRTEYLQKRKAAQVSPENLFKAIDRSDTATLRLCAENHPDFFDWLNKDGMTPMFYALKKNNLEMFKLMGSLGANINQRNSKEKSPPTLIHQAVFDGKGDFVRLLLDLNANTSLKAGWDESRLKFYAEFSANSHYSITPGALAKELKFQDIASMIEQKGKTPAAKSPPHATVAASQPAKDENLLEKFNALAERVEKTEKQLAEALQEIATLKGCREPITIKKSFTGKIQNEPL